MIEGEVSEDINYLWDGFRDELQNKEPYWRDNLFRSLSIERLYVIYNDWRDWKKSSPANVEAKLARLEASAAASSSSSSSSSKKRGRSDSEEEQELSDWDNEKDDDDESAAASAKRQRMQLWERLQQMRLEGADKYGALRL